MPADKAGAGYPLGWGQPPRTRPGQGLLAQASWPLPRPPSQASFPVLSALLGNRGRKWGAWEGEPPWEGEPLSQSPQDPNFVGQEDASWSLGRNGKARRPGLMPSPKLAPRRVPQEGEQHMESQPLPHGGRGSRPSTACHPDSFLLLPAPSRDIAWGRYSLALCGLQQWAPESLQPLPSGSHRV